MHLLSSGIAYGITFAWKDWKCGMDLAKKLKRQGHHVEVDRKRAWYKDEKERDRKLSAVLGSVRITYNGVFTVSHFENGCDNQRFK